MSVVGEGIEQQTQATQLEALGCDSGQGFLFARPHPPELIGNLLQRTTTLRAAA